MSKKDLEYFIRKAYEVYQTIPNEYKKEDFSGNTCHNISYSKKEDVDNVELGRFVREAAMLSYEYRKYKVSFRESRRIGFSIIISFITCIYILGIILLVYYGMKNQYYERLQLTRIIITILALCFFAPLFIYAYYFNKTFKNIGKNTGDAIGKNFPVENMEYSDDWKEFDNLMDTLDNKFTKKKDNGKIKYEDKYNPEKKSIDQLGKVISNAEDVVNDFKKRFKNNYTVDGEIYQGLRHRNHILQVDNIVKQLDERIQPFRTNGYTYDTFTSSTKKLLTSLFLNFEDTCPNVDAPVCSVDGTTYKNMCTFKRAGNTEPVHLGPCEGPPDEEDTNTQKTTAKQEELKRLQDEVLLNPFPQTQDTIARIPTMYPKAHKEVIVKALTNKRSFVELSKDDVKAYVFEELYKTVSDKTYIAGMRHNISQYIDIVFVESNRKIEGEEFKTTVPGHVPFIHIYEQLRSLTVGELKETRNKWKEVYCSIQSYRNGDMSSKEYREHRNDMHFQFMMFIVSYIILLAITYAIEKILNVNENTDNIHLKQANYALITILFILILINIPYRWYITNKSQQDIKHTNTKTLYIATKNTYNYINDFLRQLNGKDEDVSNDDVLVGELIGEDISTDTIENYLGDTDESKNKDDDDDKAIQKAYLYYKEAVFVSRVYREDHYIQSARQSEPFPIFGFIIRTLLLGAVILGIWWIMREYNPVSMAKSINISVPDLRTINTTMLQSIVSLILLFIVIIGLAYNMSQLNKATTSPVIR